MLFVHVFLFKYNLKFAIYDKITFNGITGKGRKMRSAKLKMTAVLAALAVSMTSAAGCSQLGTTSGLTAKVASSSEAGETTASSAISESKAETSQTKQTSEEKTDATFTKETFNAKKAELGKTPNAIGTTYLGESENAAALEVVLAQMGVSEDLIGSDSTHIIDCGGTDIWFLCFSDDVTGVRVILGDELDGPELFKGENPGYLFIRCVGSGEVPACTVETTGTNSGVTIYYPFMIGDQILLPNGGGVLNQSEGIESFTDEYDGTDNSENTEEEMP